MQKRKRRLENKKSNSVEEIASFVALTGWSLVEYS